MSLPRICGCICISPQKRVLCVKGRHSKKWSFPKGHRNPNESPNQCAIRELWEETGLDAPELCQRVLPLSSGLYYVYSMLEEKTAPKDCQEVEDVAWLSLEELAGLNLNLDMNSFLWNYSTLLKTQRIRYTIPQMLDDEPLTLPSPLHGNDLWSSSQCHP